MSVSLEIIKQLREQTGVGINDCKAALEKANGDLKKAQVILKEMGLASMAKREARQADEGAIFASIDNNFGILLDMACETDFVARTDDFKNFSQSLTEQIASLGSTELTEEQKTNVAELTLKLKENIFVRQIQSLKKSESDFFAHYIHDQGSIGVLVQAHAEQASVWDQAEAKEAIFNCALHVAAFAPQFLDQTQVDQNYLKEQRLIFEKQNEKINKPAAVLEGIIEGKMNKMLKQVCLMDQAFVKDEQMSVRQYLESVSKKLNTKINIVEFLYSAIKR